MEFENDRVRVLRVEHGAGERQPQTSRNDRLIIYLNQGHIKRFEKGKEEEILRNAGEVVWRNQSEHQIENLNDADHAVVIVELK